MEKKYSPILYYIIQHEAFDCQSGGIIMPKEMYVCTMIKHGKKRGMEIPDNSGSLEK